MTAPESGTANERRYLPRWPTGSGLGAVATFGRAAAGRQRRELQWPAPERRNCLSSQGRSSGAARIQNTSVLGDRRRRPAELTCR